MAANRVQIAVALDDELAKRAAIDAGVARMGGLQQWWASANDVTRGYVVNFDDPTDALASNQHHIEYYNTLLYEQVDNPVQRPEVPPKVGHQILCFDPPPRRNAPSPVVSAVVSVTHGDDLAHRA
jgi:hypothetical protein